MPKGKQTSMYMSRFLMILLFIGTMFHNAFAQKKEMAQVRTYLKSGKELEKGEKMMRQLLTDSAMQKNEKAWLLLYDVIKRQYDIGNEKLYLKQSYDTATIFNLTRKIFLVLEKLDSVELENNSGVADKLKYRKKHGELLNLYRQNLYNGGLYFIRKKMYDKAYDFFDHYVRSAEHPILLPYHYLTSDALMPEAAYWSVYCGYKMQNPQDAQRHISLALKDKKHYASLLQYLADIYLLDNNTARYLVVLEAGFVNYPTEPFYYSRLIDFYSQKGDWETVNNYVDKARERMKDDLWLKITKSTAVLNLERYSECISICDSIIAQGDSLPEAYLNAGLAYFNQAVKIDKSVPTRSGRKQMINLYRQALPYMVQYRKLQPLQSSRWLLPLYTIYLNLNMGKEFEEIDRLIKENTK